MIISKQNIIIASLLISLLSLGSLTVLNRPKTTIDNRVAAALPNTLEPSPTTFIPTPLRVEVMDSPDGTATFTMEAMESKTYVQYSFFYTHSLVGEKTLIFSEELPGSKYYTIPFNTWSPDNTYIFLHDTDGEDKGNIVFSVTGESFSDGSRYLDVTELFSSRFPEFAITEITGWAAPDLLLVNTIEDEKGTKVSYWFNVKTQAFTRLSNYFY